MFWAVLQNGNMETPENVEVFEEAREDGEEVLCMLALHTQSKT